jgi:hypothetical protein
MLGKYMPVVITRASLKKQKSQVLLTLYQTIFLTSGRKWHLLCVVIVLPNLNCEKDVTQHFRIVLVVSTT